MGKLKKSKTSQQKSKEIKFKIQSKNNVNFKAKSKIGKSTNKAIKRENVRKTIKKVNENNEDSVKKHDPAEIEHTIFVGNIPSNTKKSQLTSLFSPFGSVKTIRFRTSEGKRIFKHKQKVAAEYLNAYILMENKEAAEKALALSGTEFKGRHIRVTKAKKSTKDIDPRRILFVGNLKYSATDEKLFEIFSSCGELEYVRTLRNEKGCKGIAYVCFKKPESVTLGLELNNTLLDERPIRVKRYSKNKLKSHEDIKSEAKQLTGPARRVMEKDKKKGKASKTKNKLQKSSDKKTKVEPIKKSDYRGIQIDKKKFKKKKKKLSAMKILAKKIAPNIQPTKGKK